jgi:predicted dehydrogenase
MTILARRPQETPARPATGIAILGCGFVSDFYMATLAAHSGLRLVGAYDRDPDRLAAFAQHHGVRAYRDLDDMLRDEAVELVLNLTNPRSHFELTRACLQAGRHVYSEKPLAMDSAGAAELVHLARQCGRRLAVAPCSLLGETAQTMWKALSEGAIGQVRLVYANFDDGMMHRHDPSRWRSASGAPWPAADEFEIGCTYEHAAYLLSWLAAFFGPARRVNAYSACLLPDKGVPVATMAPDFSVGCIEYDHGIVARVTNSIVAPSDRSLVIVGDEGVLYTKSVRDDAAPVYLQRPATGLLARGLRSGLGYLRSCLAPLGSLPVSFGDWRVERKVTYARRPAFRSAARNKPVDFLRGPAEMAEAIREGRDCRLSAELGLHLTELIETLQHPERFGFQRQIRSSFEPIAPYPWTSAPTRGAFVGQRHQSPAGGEAARSTVP